MTIILPSASIPIERGENDDVKIAIARFTRASQLKQPWLSMFEECYEFALPGKESVFLQANAQRRTNKIFDETAVVGVQEFASRLQAGICPNYARWTELEAGSEIEEKDRAEVNSALQNVTEYVFDVINSSNFAQEVAESFLDLAVGTGTLHVDEGDDVLHPIRCTALPLAQVYIDVGPDDSVDYVARERKLRISQIRQRYPKARLTKDLADKLDKGEDAFVDLLEVVVRDWDETDETWCFHVIDRATKEALLTQDYVGIGSNPFIVFRWAKMAGEAWGRGPLLHAMPAIKTCNLTVELILENAEMAIAGIYTAEDDGVVNVDNIELLPGTIIPIAPGSQMRSLASAGNFDVAQLVLGDMRANIKRALYNDMLGNPDKTPMSATEVSTRMADLSRQIGSAFGRLQTELIEPFIRRVIWILRKQGRIKLPTVNGRQVRIRATSPLAQAQKHQDVTTVAGYVQTIGQMFGPQMTNVLVKSEEAAAYMGERLGIPQKLLRSEQERAQLVKMLQGAVAQQSPNPTMQQEPPPNAASASPTGS
jgi:hypothetical protein